MKLQPARKTQSKTSWSWPNRWTELNASLNLMAKEIHEGTYRPCWITKIKFLPNIYLRGKKKDERGRISKEARKLAGQVYTKYKADSLAFVRKEIQATKNAMDRALTVARSFSTKERRKLSIGLSAAKEAEAAKNKEVLGETSYQNRPHPYTRSGGRESSRKGRSMGDDSHRYWWDPTPIFIYLFFNQTFVNTQLRRRGSHFFPRRKDLLLLKLLPKTHNKMNNWES